jgi:NADPH-dependent 2,4-dienoyl-CoA reductase/sulfur reductase-like enzyme
LIAAFAERDIRFMPNRRVTGVDASRQVATLDDGSELRYELFLGVPKHGTPAAVEESGMAEAGWIPVNPRTLEAKFADGYPIGDIADTGTPKARVFAEAAAHAAASSISRAFAAKAKASFIAARGRATLSSAKNESADSMWTFSPAQDRPAPTMSRAGVARRKDQFGALECGEQGGSVSARRP